MASQTSHQEPPGSRKAAGPPEFQQNFIDTSNKRVELLITRTKAARIENLSSQELHFWLIEYFLTVSDLVSASLIAVIDYLRQNPSFADSLNNSSKYEKLQVLKLKAIESENYEFCIVLRNKQQEYSSKLLPIQTLLSTANSPGNEFLKFLNKIPAKHEHYFYAHLKDRFVSELCVDESIPAATNRSHFEQVIKRLSPSANNSSAASRTSSVVVGRPSETLKKLGLYITEENYQYAITHCKMLLKELNFVLWMESNPTLAQPYTEMSSKDLQHMAGRCEQKLSKFAEKLSEFLKLSDTVQKNVIQQAQFMAFINFSLSVYWVFSYVTFLLHERHASQSSSADSSRSDVASSSKSLLLNRKVVSVLLTNLQSVVKEIDYLNEHDFPSKMNPGTLLLGKKFDLVEGAVLQSKTHKNIMAAILT